MPLHVEILYNEYNFVAAFAVASLLALLAQGVQPMARALYEHETMRAPLPLAQILAIRASCPAAVGTEGDMVAARELIDDPAAYAAALLPPAGRPLLLP